MEVVRFKDEYELAAELYDMSPAELRGRDERQGQPLQRWIAVSEGVAVGAVATWSRPDNRTFLYFAGRDRTAYRLLTDAVVGAIRRRVHTHVDASDDDAIEALTLRGSRPNWLRRASGSASIRRSPGWTGLGSHRDSASSQPLLSTRTGCSLSTTRFGKTRLAPTDGAVTGNGFTMKSRRLPRSMPPHTSWQSTTATANTVGLVRVWRNPNGPRFGLVGVASQYRTTPIAAALLKQALTAASRWGHDTFTAETSPANAVIYPRMKRIEAESLGQFLQMVRR